MTVELRSHRSEGGVLDMPAAERGRLVAMLQFCKIMKGRLSGRGILIGWDYRGLLGKTYESRVIC